jgi:hypothetical protein
MPILLGGHENDIICHPQVNFNVYDTWANAGLPALQQSVLQMFVKYYEGSL